MNTVKRQHYVPRFYLRNFATRLGESAIHVYDKGRGTSFISSVENVGMGKYFYDLPGLRDPQILEKKFAQFERRAAPAIARTLQSLSTGAFAGFREEDQIEIAFFIAFLWVRTEESREDYAQLCETLYRQLGDELPGGQEIVRAARTPEGRARLHNQLLLTSDAPLRFAKALGPPRTWIIFRNRSPWPLLTSDHPVIVDTIDLTRPSVGPCRPWATVSIPLSPEFLLTVLPTRQGWDVSAVPDLSREDVRRLNLMQIERCTSQIFSSVEDWRLVKKRLSEAPELADPKRSRIEIVSPPS